MTFGELNAWLLIQLDDFLETLDRTSNKIKKYMTLSDDDRTQFLLQCDTITRSSYWSEPHWLDILTPVARRTLLH